MEAEAFRTPTEQTAEYGFKAYYTSRAEIHLPSLTALIVYSTGQDNTETLHTDDCEPYGN
jgi:hypothetical protein